MLIDELFMVHCASCGQRYKVIPNRDYGKDPKALKYINEDDKGRYYSNQLLHRCPSCVMSGKGD